MALKEIRFPVEWATCPNCNNDSIYAVHDPASEPHAKPAALIVRCPNCESVDKRMGEHYIIQEG